MEEIDITKHTSVVEKLTEFEFDTYDNTLFFKRIIGEQVIVAQVKVYPEQETVGVGFVTSDLDEEGELYSKDQLYFLEPHELEAFAHFTRQVKEDLFGKGVIQ